MIFPYKKNVAGEYYPIVDFLIYYKNSTAWTSALVDSGASISIFKEEVAEQLGLKIETGKEIYLGGIGGRIKGYIHQMKLKVADKTLVAPIVFSYEYKVSFSLLGRTNIFPRFRILFDEKNLVTSFN